MAGSINPNTLKQLRNRQKLSFERLATMSGVNSQTIFRIENGTHKYPRPGTVAKLCKALGVDEGMLRGDPKPEPADHEDDTFSVYPKHQVNVRIDGVARNALALISKRYGIQISQIIELAPFLFFVAAEQSLQDRKEKVKQADIAYGEVESLQDDFRHIPDVAFFPYNEGLESERRSIGIRDLFGKIVEEVPNYSSDWTYDSSEDNPFTCFLKRQAASTSAGAEFLDWNGFSGPDYRICVDEARALVGADADAVLAILCGAAVLHEMPKDIRTGPAEARAAWAKQMHTQRNADLLKTL